MIPGFLKKLVGFGGEKEGLSKAITDNAVPTEDALPNLSIAPKPTEAAPFPSTYANPMDSMPKVDAPAPVVPSFVQDPRMAGRSIADEFKMRQSDPNTNIVYREPFGAEKYNYVTNNNTELPHRSWKEALKNIATGAMAGAATHPENPLGGLIGGAAAGGVSGLVSPTAGKSMRFNTLQMPQLLQNRQMAQEQALYGAKIDAEQQKANQERATAESKYIRPTGNGDFIDTRNGNRVGPKPLPKLLNLGPGSVALNPETLKAEFSNPNKPGAPVIKPLVKSDGTIVWGDVTKPEFANLAPYEKPAKEPDNGITPYQQYEQQSKNDDIAKKEYGDVESLKTQAIAALNSDKPEVQAQAQALIGQHTAAAKMLAQRWPDRYEVKFDKTGQWAEISPKDVSRPNVNSVPVRGRGSKASSGKVNLYDPNKYADLK